MLQWIKDRLNERSTWAGLVPVFAAVATIMWPAHVAEINTIAGGLGAVFMGTKG